MKLIVAEMECKPKHIKYTKPFVCPVRGIVPAHLDVDLKIKCVGSGNFSEYINDGKIDKHKLFTDIFFGKIRVQIGKDND